MTSGQITSPGFTKTWAGGDDPEHKRENQYAMWLSSQTDGQWCHSGTGWCVDAYTGTGAGLLGLPAVDFASDSEILDSLLRKIQTQKFNAGMFLGEGREALTMIRDAASKVNSAITAMEHKNASGVLKALNYLGRTPPFRLAKIASAASAGFLAWNFGWKPVLSDMKTGAETLSRLTMSEDRLYASSKIVVVKEHHGYYNSTPPKWARREMVRRVQFRHKLSQEVLLKEALHLGDPWSMAYDLVPLSFVLDWFLPVGDLLGRLHAARLASTMQCSETLVDKRRGRLRSFPANVAGVPGDWVGNYNFKDITMTRDPQASVNFEPPLPRPTFPTSFFAASTIVSLVTQRILGGK